MLPNIHQIHTVYQPVLLKKLERNVLLQTQVYKRGLIPTPGSHLPLSLSHFLISASPSAISPFSLQVSVC